MARITVGEDVGFGTKRRLWLAGWRMRLCSDHCPLPVTRLLSNSDSLTRTHIALVTTFTHSLTGSFTLHLSLNHTFSQLLNHLLIQSYIHSIARSLGRSFVQSLNHPIMILVTGKILVCGSITVSGTTRVIFSDLAHKHIPCSLPEWFILLFCICTLFFHQATDICHYPQFALICKSPNCLRWHWIHSQ